eukprot:jgi/Astpho2/7515/Aster-02081
MAKQPQQNPLVCHGHTRPIVELSYSPLTPDGYFLVSASKDGAPMLRNGETGDWIGTFQGHKGAVWSCVLNKEALLAATASADFSARVWNAVTGDETLNLPHKHIVRSVAFTSDSQTLVAAGHEKQIRLFSLGKSDAEPRCMAASAPIRSAIVHPKQEHLILSTYVDKPNIEVWDTRTQQIAQTLLTEGTVLSLEAPQDGSSLFTAAHGNTVSFWDGNNFERVKKFDMAYPVESASLCAGSKRFAAGGGDMWAHLYNFEDGQELQCNKGHHGPVHCVRFAPGGKSYASGSEDGTIRIWETEWPKAEPASANGTAES